MSGIIRTNFGLTYFNKKWKELNKLLTFAENAKGLHHAQEEAVERIFL